MVLIPDHRQNEFYHSVYRQLLKTMNNWANANVNDIHRLWEEGVELAQYVCG